MFSRIKYQKKSVYLKFSLLKIQGKIKSLQKKKKRKLIPLQKNAVKATLCFLHCKTLGFGQLALYHDWQYTNATNLDEIKS